MDESIGQRVRRAMARTEGLTQHALAVKIGLTPDALSRSINGHRAFSASELVAIAGELKTSVEWIITGSHGAYEPKLSARHAFDQAAGHVVHDWAAAKNAVADVVLAYQQVRFSGHPVPPLSRPTATEAAANARQQLIRGTGERFVDDLPGAIEAAFGIDVFVLPPRAEFMGGHNVFTQLSDEDHAYAGEVNGQQFIVISSGGAWYRKNFALAHELAHLLRGDPCFLDEHRPATMEETWANAFASELLAPQEVIARLDWAGMSEQEVAQRLLEFGVSTQVLTISVSRLGVRGVPALNESTVQLVRRHEPKRFEQVERLYRTPRFPPALVDAHHKAVNEDGLAPGTLAWMLGIAPEDLRAPDLETEASGVMEPHELMAALGLG